MHTSLNYMHSDFPAPNLHKQWISLMFTGAEQEFFYAVYTVQSTDISFKSIQMILHVFISISIAFLDEFTPGFWVAHRGPPIGAEYE